MSIGEPLSAFPISLHVQRIRPPLVNIKSCSNIFPVKKNQIESNKKSNLFDQLTKKRTFELRNLGSFMWIVVLRQILLCVRSEIEKVVGNT